MFRIEDVTFVVLYAVLMSRVAHYGEFVAKTIPKMNRVIFLVTRISLLRIILIVLFPLCLWSQKNAQPENIRIQQADFRGKGYDAAANAALQASRNDVLVVLICGASQDVIEATEAELKVLAREGYNRVAMITSDPDPVPEDNPVVAIIVNLENPSYMTDVSVHSEYHRDLYNSIRKAYDQYILSKLKNE